MKHKLISVGLIAVLLCMVLGNGISCAPPTTTYTLTMSSTAGGSVTPAVGAHTYNATAVVNLVATPDADYYFVNWTGNVGTIANVTAATTTINMTGNYAITANFGFNMTYIVNVPDTSQPPTNTLGFTPPGTGGYCAPMAMVNVLEYWDDVMNHANAQNVTAGLANNTTAEYLGWFMNTNGNGIGSPPRANVGSLGTFDVDIGPGTVDFVRWDNAHNFTTPPPALPAGKLGYNWTVTQNCTTDYVSSLAIYKAEIDAGRPLVVSFDYWNPVFGINFTDPQSGETISVHNWGLNYGYSQDPEEYWYGDIGHAVTGVGYKLNWDPDGSGPLNQTAYVIVYDNWLNTPKNIAIPWAFWKCLFAVDPSS